MLIASGHVNSEMYTGEVEIHLKKTKPSSIIDLEVHHGRIQDYDVFDCPADQDDFSDEVIRLLHEAGKLPNEDYCLIRAELGMQKNRIAVFELIYQGNKNVSKQVMESWLSGEKS